MRKGIKRLLPLAGLYLVLFVSAASAQGQGAPKDVFKGKLFPPNVILEHQDQLNLSKDQFTAIRAAVVEVQEPKLQMVISGPDDVLFGKPQRYQLRNMDCQSLLRRSPAFSFQDVGWPVCGYKVPPPPAFQWRFELW